MGTRVRSPESGKVGLHFSRTRRRAVSSLACGLALAAYAAPVVLPAARDVAHLVDHHLARTQAHPHEHGQEPGSHAGTVDQSRRGAGTAHVHGPGGAHVHRGLAGGLLALAGEPEGEVKPGPVPVRTAVDLHNLPALPSPLGLRTERAADVLWNPPDPAAAPDLLPPTPPPRA